MKKYLPIIIAAACLLTPSVPAQDLVNPCTVASVVEVCTGAGLNPAQVEIDDINWTPKVGTGNEIRCSPGQNILVSADIDYEKRAKAERTTTYADGKCDPRVETLRIKPDVSISYTVKVGANAAVTGVGDHFEFAAPSVGGSHLVSVRFTIAPAGCVSGVAADLTKTKDISLVVENGYGISAVTTNGAILDNGSYISKNEGLELVLTARFGTKLPAGYDFSKLQWASVPADAGKFISSGGVAGSGNGVHWVQNAGFSSSVEDDVVITATAPGIASTDFKLTVLAIASASGTMEINTTDGGPFPSAYRPKVSRVLPLNVFIAKLNTSSRVLQKYADFDLANAGTAAKIIQQPRQPDTIISSLTFSAVPVGKYYDLQFKCTTGPTTGDVWVVFGEKANNFLHVEHMTVVAKSDCVQPTITGPARVLTDADIDLRATPPLNAAFPANSLKWSCISHPDDSVPHQGFKYVDKVMVPYDQRDAYYSVLLPGKYVFKVSCGDLSDTHEVEVYEEGAYVRFRYYNKTGSGSYDPLPRGTEVAILDYNFSYPWFGEIKKSGREIGSYRINNDRGELFVPKDWENGEDVYFEVRMNHQSPDVTVQYGKVEKNVTWTSFDKPNGYFEDITVDVIGGSRNPIVFTIHDNDPDSAGWANDAAYVIKCIQQTHEWYRGKLPAQLSWPGVEDLDVEISTTLPNSWASPFSATLGLSDELKHQWDLESISHEYSHQVMYESARSVGNEPLLDVAYDFFTGEFFTSHGFDVDTNPDTAYLEGWAEYVEWAVPESVGLAIPSPSIRGGYWKASDGNGINNSGESLEGAVANIFYRIDKEVVNGSRPLYEKLFWNNLKGPNEDVKEFHDFIMTSAEVATDVKQAIRNIYQDNGVVYSRLMFTQPGVGSILQIPAGFQANFRAREMSAEELHTKSLPRDVADVTPVEAAVFQVLSRPLSSASDTATIVANLYNAATWRDIVTSGKESDGTFKAVFDPSTMGLAPGLYAVRAKARDTNGTTDNFKPDLGLHDGSGLNTAMWHKQLGVIAVVAVVGNIDIDISEVASDQIAGNRCNMLPTAYYVAEPNNPMLMATRSGVDARLAVRATASSSGGSSAYVGVRRVGDVQILGSSRIVPGTVTTSLRFNAIAGSEIYEVVGGWDSNQNATLDSTEVSTIFRKTPPIDASGMLSADSVALLDKIIVVTSDEWSFERSFLMISIEELFGLEYCGQLINSFLYGSTSVANTILRTGIPISSTVAGLSHPLGAKWSANCGDTTHQLIYADQTRASDNFENSKAMEEIVAAIVMRNISALLAAGSNVLTDSPVMNFSESKNLIITESELIGFNELGLSFGKVTINGSLRIRYRKSSVDTIVVDSISSAGAFDDLYDFSYGGGYAARKAAKVQAGYATLSSADMPSGKIFFTRLEYVTGWKTWSKQYTKP